MKYKLTIIQIIKLIFFSGSVKIDGKKYKLPFLVDSLKICMNLFFIFGGIVIIAVGFDKVFEYLNFEVFGYLSFILSIILIFVLNILIVKYSPFIEV